MKTPLNQLLALAAVWYLTTAGAHARTIAWSDSVNDNIYQANGTSFLDAGYNFEIGAFTYDVGFTSATLANIDQWRSHWRTFDSAQLNTEWLPANRFFTSSGTVQAGGVSSVTGQTFTTGEQGFLWVYNNTTIQAGTQWGLFTSSLWTYPISNPSDPNDIYWTTDPLAHDPVNFVYTANSAIIGGLNNTQAAGSTGYTAPSGSFTLQTHAVPVPEPGSCLLMGLAGLVFQLRRRSKVGRR